MLRMHGSRAGAREYSLKRSPCALERFAVTKQLTLPIRRETYRVQLERKLGGLLAGGEL
jgi:hypothetical protein